MSMKRILVTGATGLVGNALVPALLEAGWSVRACARKILPTSWSTHPRCEFVCHDVTSGPGSLTNGIHAVVHLAARVHIMHETSSNPLAENRRINTMATVQLAEAAAASGTEQFIHLSSIKVNGEESLDHPFTESDPASPKDPYAISKHEAELGLAAIAERFAMGITVLRPPLIYGVGVKGNFATLMRAIERGLPLPLGAVQNRRSLISVRNLSDAILAVLNKPAPGFRTYLVSDGEDFSTPQLIRTMAAAMNCRPNLWAIPPVLLRLTGKLTGRAASMDRLLGSLVIDSSLIRRELQWTPRWNAMQAMAADFSIWSQDKNRRTNE